MSCPSAASTARASAQVREKGRCIFIVCAEHPTICCYLRCTVFAPPPCIRCLSNPLAFLLPGVFGAYLLSVYDPESETYQTISKLGTGFSEEVRGRGGGGGRREERGLWIYIDRSDPPPSPDLQVLQQLADCMAPHIIPKPRKYFSWSEGLEPDVWFDAVKVG